MSQKNGLKVLAFVISLTLWTYVQITTKGLSHNSVTQLVIRVPLELKGNGSHLIPFEKSTDTIRVTLRGDSSVVDELRVGMVRAYVNLENIAAGSAWPEVQVVVPGGIQILNTDPKSVNVRLSPLMVKEVPIKVETTGAPREGYQVGVPQFSPKVVKIEGPEELVGQVSLVSGLVHVEGFRETVSLSLRNLVPVNENGTAVMGRDSILRKAVTEVQVTIPVEQQQSVESLPVLLENVKVTKKEGYAYRLEADPEFVQVSTSLEGEQLPKGIQAAPLTLKLSGDLPETVELDLVSQEGMTFLGASKVRIKVTPEKKTTTTSQKEGDKNGAN